MKWEFNSESFFSIKGWIQCAHQPIAAQVLLLVLMSIWFVTAISGPVASPI